MQNDMKQELNINFICKANHSGYCKQWLRECVSWNNCNLGSYGSPCPGCNFSSPLERNECKSCEYFSWKKENYI